MSEQLKIVQLNPNDDVKHPLPHDLLPNPSKCFRLISIAPSHSGKSLCILNMVTRPEFGLSDYYKENIFLISETLGLDKTWASLNLPKHHKIDHWDEEIMSEIMEYSEKQPHGCLLIMDDMVCSKAIDKVRGTLLDRLYMMGRHHKISLIMTSQRYFSLSPQMRLNASHVIVFNLMNASERKSFLNDFVSIKNLPHHLDTVTSERYQFLYIDVAKGAVYRNFEEQLE